MLTSSSASILNQTTPDLGIPIRFNPSESGSRARSLQVEAIDTLVFHWSMIFSENRIPLFRIML
jgi:hypothetical protein